MILVASILILTILNTHVHEWMKRLFHITVELSKGNCPGGICPGSICPRSICPRSICPRGAVVLGVVVLRGNCLG